LRDVKDSIVSAVNQKSQAGKVNAKDVADAVGRFSRTTELAPDAEKSMFDEAVINILNVPGIIWISAILSIVFGILGAVKENQSLSDIAKVFAGAIVGASGVTATNAIKKP